MVTLQNIIMPTLASYADRALFFRLNDHAQFSYENQTIYLASGGKANFATYFNQFSITRWRAFTEVKRVQLELEYEGEGLLTFTIHQFKQSPRVFGQHKLDAEVSGKTILDLPPLDKLDSGLISFHVSTLGNCLLRSARFVTPQEPPRKVVLGISITAFKRNQYVIPAVARLHRDLLSGGELADRIHLCVVDNGHTLSDDDVPETCKIIRNRNYGGAGGFSRGLYHYDKCSQGVSHCLFMDDDASCESEAIKRTVALLDFASDDRLAVAGAMMLERLTYIQHEAGAVFNRSCQPLKHGLDLRSRQALLENDMLEEVGYGAWWFFAFPISHLKHYPFPYFVRGDDILFSMTNPFRIATLNGICSWQECFTAKSSPLTMYLDMRSHICHYLMSDKLNSATSELLLVFWHFLLKNNAAYQYASAEAICIALADVLKPVSFWRENMDMSAKRAQLAPLVDRERLVSMAGPRVAPLHLENPAGIFSRVLRLLTLNGHLIPTLFFKKNVTVTKEEAPFLRKSFLARDMTVYHYESSTGVILRHDKSYFFRNIFQALGLSLRLVLAARSLRSRAALLEAYMTPEFWEQQFRLETEEQVG